MLFTYLYQPQKSKSISPASKNIYFLLRKSPKYSFLMMKKVISPPFFLQRKSISSRTLMVNIEPIFSSFSYTNKYFKLWGQNVQKTCLTQCTIWFESDLIDP